MEKIKCKIDQLKVGMTIAENVYTVDNILLVSKDTKVTQRIITRFNFYSIPYVYVAPEKVEDLNEFTYYQKIEETKEFKVFSETLNTSARRLKATLRNSIQRETPINTTLLQQDLEYITREARNNMHILQMLQCIRNYDDMIYVHCINVGLISAVIGEWCHFKEEDIKLLKLCGELHDIGKIMVPEELLVKSGKLSAEEFNVIKSHAIRGYEVVKNKDLDEHIKLSVLQHHERCDGTGYPMGLKLDKIDEFAKIVAIADVYDAMTCNRTYRQAICPFVVIETFEKEGYQKYDPKYLLPFLQGISDSYINANVMLNNKQKGEVVMINRANLSRPIIRVGSDCIDLTKHPELTIEAVL